MQHKSGMARACLATSSCYHRSQYPLWYIPYILRALWERDRRKGTAHIYSSPPLPVQQFSLFTLYQQSARRHCTETMPPGAPTTAVRESSYHITALWATCCNVEHFSYPTTTTKCLYGTRWSKPEYGSNCFFAGQPSEKTMNGCAARCNDQTCERQQKREKNIRMTEMTAIPYPYHWAISGYSLCKIFCNL